MEKRNLRVMVASESPQARAVLKEVVEKDGTFFVGQAQDVTRAVTLARNLRPDVAIIDCYLPFSVGLDTVRLSRIGGLDTAQLISETTPNTLVIVVTNLDAHFLTEYGSCMNAPVVFSTERMEGSAALTVEKLWQETAMPAPPVFANVEVGIWPATSQKGNETSEGAMFLGTAGIIAGGYLIATLILAPVGVVLVLVGGLAVLFGLIRKAAARLGAKKSRAS